MTAFLLIAQPLLTAAIILTMVAAFGWWVEWRMGRKKVGTDDK